MAKSDTAVREKKAAASDERLRANTAETVFLRTSMDTRVRKLHERNGPKVYDGERNSGASVSKTKKDGSGNTSAHIVSWISRTSQV